MALQRRHGGYDRHHQAGDGRRPKLRGASASGGSTQEHGHHGHESLRPRRALGPAEATARNLLYYALSLPIATAVVGHPTVEHLEENIRLAKAFQPLTKTQMQQLSRALSTRNRTALVEYFRHHVDA